MSLLQSQVVALLSTFATSTDITLEVATEVTREIVAGPWSDEQKIQLAAGLAEAQVRVVRRGPRATQTCTTLENFFTDAEWAMIMNEDLSLAPKIQTVAGRMWKLGMTCPSEKTLMRAGAVVVVGAQPGVQLKAAEKQSVCLKVKEAVKVLDKARPHPIPHVTSYPLNPANLPQHLFSFAYGEGAAAPRPPPELGPFEDIVSSMCYRKTHKDLRTTNFQPFDLSMPSTNGANPAAFMSMMFKAMQAFAGRGCGEEPSLHLTGHPRRAASRLALCEDDLHRGAATPDGFNRVPTTPVSTTSSGSRGDDYPPISPSFGDGGAKVEPLPSLPAIEPVKLAPLALPAPFTDERTEMPDPATELEKRMRAAAHDAKAKAKAKAKATKKKATAKSKAKAKAKARAAAESAAEGAATDAGEATEDGEADEKVPKATAAVKKAAAKAKAAAAKAAALEAKVAAKAAATKKPSTKRSGVSATGPAAASGTIAPVDVADLLDTRGVKRTVKQFTSRAYHISTKRALVAGMSPEAAKAFGRQTYAEASTAFLARDVA